MSARTQAWIVTAGIVVALLAGGGNFASYQAGYFRGRQEVRRAWEGAAYEKLIGELGMCVRSLQTVARNPKAFTAAERSDWRDQTVFLVRMLEDGLLPRLAAGEQVEAYGEPFSETKVRRLVEQAKKLLARVPA